MGNETDEPRNGRHEHLSQAESVGIDQRGTGRTLAPVWDEVLAVLHMGVSLGRHGIGYPARIALIIMQRRFGCHSMFTQPMMGKVSDPEINLLHNEVASPNICGLPPSHAALERQ